MPRVRYIQIVSPSEDQAQSRKAVSVSPNRLSDTFELEPVLFLQPPLLLPLVYSSHGPLGLLCPFFEICSRKTDNFINLLRSIDEIPRRHEFGFIRIDSIDLRIW